MRVIQLATSRDGGAGIAARRTNDCLGTAGVDSWLYTRDQIQLSSKKGIVSKLRHTALRFESSALTVAQSKLIQSGSDLTTPLSLHTLDLKMLLKEKFDILHIHAFYNFLNIESISKLARIGVPIVITLHDQRLLTGGCHYSRDCRQFQQECKACPQTRKIFQPLVLKSFNSQIRLLQEHKNITLISPSIWLAEICKESVVAQNTEVHIVNNPVPDCYFENAINNAVDDNTKHIGFSAANLINPYKGIQVFVKAVNELNKRNTNIVNVLLIGKGEAPEFSPQIQVARAEPNSDLEMIKELKKLRVLVVPSSQDNSPSVISEALAMGIPVVGSNVGGIPELLRDFGLPIFEQGDFVQLAKNLVEPLPTAITSQITRKALANFSEANVAKKLLKIYSNLH